MFSVTYSIHEYSCLLRLTDVNHVLVIMQVYEVSEAIVYTFLHMTSSALESVRILRDALSRSVKCT